MQITNSYCFQYESVEDSGKTVFHFNDKCHLITVEKDDTLSRRSLFVSKENKCLSLFALYPEIANALFLYQEDEDTVRFAEWSQNILQFYATRFFVVLPNPSQRLPNEEGCYKFKPGTKILDISNDESVESRILTLLGFDFFKLNIDKLRNSSPCIQRQLMLGLLSRHFYVCSGNWNIKKALLEMPGCLAKDMHYFLLQDKRIGTIAGAAFVEIKEGIAKLKSITIHQKLQNNRLGTLLLVKMISFLNEEMNYTKVYLKSVRERLYWYESFGFRNMYPGSDSGMLLLSLDKQDCRKAFTHVRAQLPFYIFLSMFENKTQRTLGGSSDFLSIIRFIVKNDPDLKNLECVNRQEIVKKKLAFIEKLAAKSQDVLSPITLQLKEIEQEIPYKIDAAYIATGPTVHSEKPAFSFDDVIRYEFDKQPLGLRLKKIRARIHTFETQISTLPSQIVRTMFNVLSAKKAKLVHLSQRLARFLPVVLAEKNTVFLYHGVKYKKLSSRCFSIIPESSF